MALSELEHNLRRESIDAEDYEFMHLAYDDEVDAVDAFEIDLATDEEIAHYERIMGGRLVL